MKRLSGKVAAIILVAVMIASLFPASVFAENTDEGNVIPTVVEQNDGGDVIVGENYATTNEATDSGEKPAEENTEEPAAPQEPSPAVEEPVVVEPEPVIENTITSQPEDAIIAPNDKAVFTIETTGKVSSYKWQYSSNGESWKSLSVGSKKSSVTVTGSNSRFKSNDGYLYRCIVTFKDKTTVTSDVATLHVSNAQSFTTPADGKYENADVSAEAPAGTFPTGTEMVVSDVDAEDCIDAINEVLPDAGVADVTAVDISFEYEGQEKEPANDNKVEVTIKSDAVNLGVRLVHIEEIDGETIVTEIPSEDIVSIKNGEIVFKSDAFSIYAVVDPGEEGENARVTVNFYGWTFTKDEDGNITAMTPSLITSYYVKNADTLEMIEKTVADPGIGNLGENLLFHGWSVDDTMRPTAEALANLPLKPYDESPSSYALVGEDQKDGANYTPTTEVLTIEKVREYLYYDVIGHKREGSDPEGFVGNIHEGDVVNVYAGIYKFFDVTYFGADAQGNPRMTVSLGTDTVLLRPTSSEAQYTVSMNFSPHANQNFKGWKADEDSGSDDNISGVVGEYSDEVRELIAQGIYPNSTKITIVGDILFICEAPIGNWLVYNGNGKGATFNAPQFYLEGQTTSPAMNAVEGRMERNGYSFKGWYEAAGYDEDGNPIKGEDGEVILKDTAFVFGNVLEENTNIFAKWQMNETAPYTIVFWQQNANRTAYVAVGSYKGMQGRVGQPIPFTFKDNTDEDYVTDVGSNGHYTGFTLNHSGTNTLGDLQKTTGYDSAGNPVKETVDIPNVTADGNAVLNLYYDRIVYNLKFYMYRQTAGRNQTYDPNGQRSYATQSNNGQNVWSIAGSWQNVSEADVPSIGNAPGSNAPRYTIVREETAKPSSITSGNPTYYFGYYFTLSAYYGENIESKWPTYDEVKGPNNDGTKAVSFVMMNGTGLKGNAYNGNGYGDGRDTIKGVITVMDDNILGLTNDANGNFLIVRYASYNNWTYHIYYECIPGVEYDSYVTRTINGVTKNYYWDHDVSSRSSNTIAANQNPPQFEGYTVAKNADGNEYQDGYGGNAPRQDNITGYTVYLNYYYNRIQKGIKYMDGVYLNGNGETIQTKASNVIWDTTDPDDGITDRWITYEAAIPEDLVNYTPSLQAGEVGYVFEGWYLDEGCTIKYPFSTMPVDGIIVYARWRQIQYRVFLHPEAEIETEDEQGNKIMIRDLTLSWGDESAGPDDKQQMNFRRAWGQKISLPTGTRKGYDFLGWYMKDGTVFSAVTELNDTTVPVDPTDPNYIEYNKETDMTDIMDKFGYIIKKGEEYWVSNEQRINEDTEPYNSDARRTWITNRLDLYGKWSKIIEGSDGIIVEFDAVAGQGVFNLDDGTTSVIVREPLLYKDNSEAIAEAASTPLPKVDEEGQTVVDDDNEPVYDKQFLRWVVQTWENETDAEGNPIIDPETHEPSGQYVDLKDQDGNLVTCLPGDSYTVLLDLCKSIILETTIDPNTGEPRITKANYIMRLRAEYGPLETPRDTYFNWYRNWEEEDEPVSAEEDEEHGGLLHTDDKLQINEPRDIYTLTEGVGIPERPGYTFLGWARMSEKDTADGKITAYHEGLTEDDLYIKWVEETEKIDPETGDPVTDPETGDPVMVAAHYEAFREAKDPEGSGEWVPVTQVAADDFTPYQAYYAVWDVNFYVVHSSDGTVDKIRLSSMKCDDGSYEYDLFSTVKKDYLYGGYFKGYFNVTNKEAIEAGDKGVAIKDFTVYDGSALYTKVDGKIVRYWNKTGDKGAFTDTVETKFGGGKGTEMTPVGGMVYYLREIPKAFLDLRVQVVYDLTKDNNIDDLYLITTVDNNIFQGAGFKIITADKAASFYASFTVQPRGKAAQKTTAKDINGIGGYVAVWDGTSTLITGAAENSDFSVLPYWITLDKIRVDDDNHGTRSFNIGNKKYDKEGGMEEVTETTGG